MSENSPTAAVDGRLKFRGLVAGLSVGHGLKHFVQSTFLMLVPGLKETLGLSGLGMGSIQSVQGVSSAISNIPAGALADIYPNKIRWLLFFSMAMIGTGYLTLSTANSYLMVCVAVALLGFGSNFWHAPAFGTLAARYPRQRGLAISLHLTGAQVGNTTGPCVIGALLEGFAFSALGMFEVDIDSVLSWRQISLGVAAICLATCPIILSLMSDDDSLKIQTENKFRDYLRAGEKLVRNRHVIGYTALGGLRGAVHGSFSLFIVIHMAENLDFSEFKIGFHVALLTAAGVLSTPFLGHISDSIGRKPVIITAMWTMALLIPIFLILPTGVPFTLGLAVLGLVFFSVMPIITAAAQDSAGSGSEGSVTAMMFLGLSLVSLSSPPIAGTIYDNSSFDGVLIFCTGLAVAGALLATVLPTPPSPTIEKAA